MSPHLIDRLVLVVRCLLRWLVRLEYLACCYIAFAGRAAMLYLRYLFRVARLIVRRSPWMVRLLVKYAKYLVAMGLLRLRVLALGIAVLFGSAPSEAGAGQSGPVIVTYIAPVVGEVIDPFRPPDHIGSPGNRGLQYRVADHTPVVASAAGQVGFSGVVAGTGVIVIWHGDGLRTTYTGLQERFVDDGAIVDQGTPIARTSFGMHFGALINETYLDPQILIDASEAGGIAHLIPPGE